MQKFNIKTQTELVRATHKQGHTDNSPIPHIQRLLNIKEIAETPCIKSTLDAVRQLIPAKKT